MWIWNTKNKIIECPVCELTINKPPKNLDGLCRKCKCITLRNFKRIRL